jgi:hypothetical protein
LQYVPGGDRFDDQARSLLEGRLDVRPEVATIEGFESGGKTYLYFGIFPALLRIPILVFADADGRLGQLSILAATIMVLLSVGWLLLTAVRMRAVAAKNPRTLLGLSAVLGFVTCAGSPLVYLAHRGTVYNEAIAWGVAATLAGIACIVRFVDVRRPWLLAAASACVGAALLSRVTTGVGPLLLALAVCGLVVTGRLALADGWLRRRRVSLQRVVVIALAIIPLLAFGGIQFAKFGGLDVRPSQHVANRDSPAFEAYREANGDRYFRAAFVPTNLVALTVWPSALDVSSRFPWVRPESSALPARVGDPVMLGRYWTGSLLVTQPIFLLLGALGLVGLVRTARRGAESRSRLVARTGLAAVAGAGIGGLLLAAYAYQYHRYVADVWVPLAVLAPFGVVVIAGIGSTVARRVLAGCSVLLAAWGVWMNAALGVLDQSERAWSPSGAALRQLLWAERATGSSRAWSTVEFGAPLPTDPPLGALAVVGRCDALFMSAGQDGVRVAWWPVELGPRFRLQVSLVGEARSVETWATLLRDARGPGVLQVGSGPRGTVLRLAGAVEEDLTVDPGRRRRLVVEYHPEQGALVVLDGPRPVLRSVWSGPFAPVPERVPIPGVAEVAGSPTAECPRFLGSAATG